MSESELNDLKKEEQSILDRQIFKKYESNKNGSHISQSLIAMSSKNQAVKDCYSFSEVIQMPTSTLVDLCFEIDNGHDFVSYVQIKKKKYSFDGHERCLI
jgi:hypothetical protein